MYKKSYIALGIVSFFLTLYAISNTGNVTTDELKKAYNKYFPDPLLPRSFKEFQEKPELIPILEENFKNALYVYTQFDLKQYITIDIKFSCYQFARYLDDPKTIKYFKIIREAPFEEKIKLIRHYEDRLHIRELCIQDTLLTAYQYFNKLQLPEEEIAELTDIIKDHRYLFAHVPNDPWREGIVYLLPELRDIPLFTRLSLVHRKNWVKNKINEMNISRNSKVQRALYHMFDRLEDPDNPSTTDPHVVVKHVQCYSSDETPEIYAAFFNEYHVDRFGTYDLDLVKDLDVEVPEYISLSKNKHLHALYLHLLAQPMHDSLQREIAKICIAMIFYATVDDNPLCAQLAEHVYDSVMYDDIPKWIWNNIDLVGKAFGTDKMAELIDFLNKLHNQSPEQDV